ncbi:hypothetical protein N027_11655 [Pseudomonas syringae USA007]|uniref:Uncharacterized protein n=1 Tax=Pseudomonas syringae USA007 TaxID=1357288 RepID=A0AAU8MGJ9_PSESX|nr:hypothetical protein [Pseudomonas syringae]
MLRSRNGTKDIAFQDPLFGMHLTGGSNSIKNRYTQQRELGAHAMLLASAAARWNVDVSRLSTRASRVLGPGPQCELRRTGRGREVNRPLVAGRRKINALLGISSLS